MKKYITIAILLTLSSILVGCGQDEPKPLSSDEVVEGVSTTDSPSTAEPSPFITTDQ